MIPESNDQRVREHDVDVEFYRRQASKYLAMAEQAERFSGVSQLPVGTVVRFTAQRSRPRRIGDESRLTYAATLITMKYSDGPRDQWFLTQGAAGRRPSMTHDEFVEFLMVSKADDVQVATAWRRLGDDTVSMS